MGRKIFFIIIISLLMVLRQTNFVMAQTYDSSENYEWVIEPKFDLIFSIYSDEVAVAGVGSNPETSAYGFIDLKGNWVVEPMYGFMSGFNENGFILARVGDWATGKTGLLDSKGNWVVNPDFNGLSFFSSNGLASARVGSVSTGKHGFINENGDWVLKPIYDFAHSFTDVGIASVKYEGKWGFIDETGKWVLKPRYDYLGQVSENGLAIALDNSYISQKYGYLDISGNWLIKPQFEKAEMFSSNGLAAVKIGEHWGFINEEGDVVIEPKYYFVEKFDSNGMAAARIGDWYTGKAGYIDENGNWIIKPEYAGVIGFSEIGSSIVRYGDFENGKWGHIDRKGNWIIDPIFEHGGNFSANGFASVRMGGKWGVIKLKDSTMKRLSFSNRGASAWSYEILDQAREAQLIPYHLESDYKRYITREEFCDLIIKAYETTLKKEAALPFKSPFLDTKNENVLKSYELGIVKGVNASHFNPQNHITREAMAVMLENTLKALEYDEFILPVETFFSDEKEISNWALPSVRKLINRGILSGTANNQINPKGNVTREQAIVLVYRLIDLYQK